MPQVLPLLNGHPREMDSGCLKKDGDLIEVTKMEKLSWRLSITSRLVRVAARLI